jgi:hypothetical protein
MMAGEIMIALTLHDARVVIERGRLRLLFPEDRPPPAALIAAARARKEELRALLTDDERARQEAFEVRAAFPEFDAGAKPEAIAGAELTGDTQGGTEDGSDLHDGDGVLLYLGTYSQALATLRAECPAYVDAADWQQAVEDCQRFITKWGKQAEALGWAPADLFGLHTPPEKPAPNYRRLSRYDQTGLIWLLRGRRVVELTKDKAVIETATGTVSYRRYNKPALGPLGDSLDDVASAIAANKSDATTAKHHGLPRPDDLPVPEFLRESNV